MGTRNTLETRSRQKLTRWAWASLEEAFWSVGLDPAIHMRVVQGGFKNGAGAAASAGVHDKGDVADLRWELVPAEKRTRLLRALRRLGWCFWWRAPAFGWTSTGPHGHGVYRWSYYPLAESARQQIAAYDRKRNGLRNNAPDPWSDIHPTQVRLGPAPYPGKPIGWEARGRAVRDLQRSFGLEPTGVYDKALRAAVGAWQTSHPWAFRADGSRPGVVGQWTYRGIIRTWLAY